MLKKSLSVVLGFLVAASLCACASSGIEGSQPGLAGASGVEPGASPADVNGTWTVQSSGPRFSDNQVFYLSQKGSTITGSTISGGKVVGSVKGNSVVLRRGEGSGLVVYTGSAQGGTMQGDWESVDGYYRGSWTGVRRE